MNKSSQCDNRSRKYREMDKTDLIKRMLDYSHNKRFAGYSEESWEAFVTNNRELCCRHQMDASKLTQKFKNGQKKSFSEWKSVVQVRHIVFLMGSATEKCYKIQCK